MSTLKEKKAELEKEEIAKTIKKHETMGGVADELGISRMSLYRKMVRYGMGGFYENKKLDHKAENK